MRLEDYLRKPSDEEINYAANLYLSLNGKNTKTTFEKFLMIWLERKLRKER